MMKKTMPKKKITRSRPTTKPATIQLRCAGGEKDALWAAAKARRQTLSQYVLSRCLDR